MNALQQHRLAWLAAVALFGCASAGAQPPAEADRVLLDFRRPPDRAQIETDGAEARVVAGANGSVLRVETGDRRDWPAVILRPAAGVWDLSECEYVLVSVRNLGDEPLEVHCRVANRGHLFAGSVTGKVLLPPRADDTIEVTLQRPTTRRHGSLVGMNFYPVFGPGPLDASRVAQIGVFLHRPARPRAFEVERVTAGGRYRPQPEPRALVPFIDRFGQYAHADWPGKIRSEADLERRRQAEAADLEAHPGADSWNRWGGFEDGPQLEATGAFRVQKHRGKWWLVDPDGRLFWSHGITCVRSNSGMTPITDRLDYFEELPGKDSPLRRFYGERSTVPVGYYVGRTYEVFDFTKANLFRKYGPSWPRDFADVSHRRLRSWGMNTIGHFSSPDVYLDQRTPYTVGVVYHSPLIRGSEGHWQKFPDPFDPEFRTSLLRALNREHRHTARDPWCIGYFINNELSWGGPLFLAIGALRSPPDQAAKRAFVEDLTGKYRTIEALNRAWGTSHGSFEDLLAETRPPEPKRAREDLLAFTAKTAERYFETCRQVLEEFAPDRLYLGCRFTPEFTAATVRAAARSCDVISYNLYWRDLRGLRLPPDVDRPVLIGEFDFVAMDRGHFHPGLQGVPTQARRALAYQRYVESALAHAAVVGTHWYQYYDLPASGEPNGLNMQSGFLDICDSPYPETIEACRRVGYRMYETRGAAR